MQRKLIATVVAAALELMLAAPALGACPANGAQPFSVGQVNPVNGFGEYVSDGKTSLQICTDLAYCFFDPVVAGNLLSEQIGSGTESFYWLAQTQLREPGAGFSAQLTMAAEATFTTPEPLDGQQLTFTRLRIRIDVPSAGTYTVKHPFGEETYTVLADAIGPGQEIRDVIDLPFTPGQSNALGKVGPWLRWDPVLAPTPPRGFIGDGNTLQPVVGSPCDTNYFEVSGVDPNGNAIVLTDAGDTIASTDLFIVQGQLFDGRVQTPLSTDRLAYSRKVGQTTAQLDAFALSSGSSRVELRDAPGTATANRRFTTPQALQADGEGLNSSNRALPAASAANTALPKALTLVAQDDPAVMDPTSLIVAVTDTVTITQADYDLSTGLLTVRATSSDEAAPPRLEVAEYGVTSGTPVATRTPPANVTVLSSAGGSDTAAVRVVLPVLPAAPTGLAVSASTPISVTLGWQDQSDNESDFEIYRDGASAAIHVPSVAPSEKGNRSAVVQSLQELTSYTFQVRARNGAGNSAFSNSVSVRTPAKPLLAGSNLRSGSVTASTISLLWTDTLSATNDGNANESGYRILRDGKEIAVIGPNSTVFNDSNLKADTAYTYEVVAYRTLAQDPEQTAATRTGAGGSGSATLSVKTLGGVVTLKAPSNLTASTANQPELAWTDNSVNETGYRVTRKLVSVTAGGASSTPANGVTLSGTGLAANSFAFIDKTTGINAVATGRLYVYDVQALNTVAGVTTSGAVSSVATVPGGMPVVNTPTLTLGNRNSRQIRVTWAAPSNTTPIANYRLEVCTVTAQVPCTGTTGFRTLTTIARGQTLSFQHTGLSANTRYAYRVVSVGPTAYPLESTPSTATAATLAP